MIYFCFLTDRVEWEGHMLIVCIINDPSKSPHLLAGTEDLLVDTRMRKNMDK